MVAKQKRVFLLSDSMNCVIESGGTFLCRSEALN